VIAIGVGLAAGAIAGSPASAAILALTFTLGTWAVDFTATVQGGWVTSLAGYTPSALLRAFENGEIRVSSILIASLVALLGVWVAAIAIEAGNETWRRATRSVAAVVIVAAVMFMIPVLVHASADVSEDRRTSFPEDTERALRAIHEPLRLDANLGPEDPRRLDLEREILAKLQRVMDVHVNYVGQSNTGLTSRSEHYGEMVYSMGDRADTTRSVIEPVVLELIYKLARVTPPSGSAEEAPYPGYPKPVPPPGIALVFFVLWPAAVLGCWAASRKMI
jgi:ABC-2 type transport system permease protein